MFHYTTNVNSKTALVSCHFKGWHADLYDTYFDSFVESHIEFAKFNNMDYHCFNSGILNHYNIPVDIATRFMGLTKWFLVMYAFELGYENVFVTDLDTKFLRNESFDEEVYAAPLAVSCVYGWTHTITAWTLYSMMALGMSYDKILTLNNWYGGGFFKVNRSLQFQQHLIDYYNFSLDVCESNQHPVYNANVPGRFIRHIFTPFDEVFLQHIIAKNEIDYKVLDARYNATVMDSSVIHFHFTDKSLIPLHCNNSNKLLNHLIE
jgi:hypothetical protein